MNFRYIYIGSLWAGIRFVLNIIKSLAIVPIFLSIWDEKLYSYWLIILSIQMLIQTVNLGYLQYIGNEINLQFHTHKENSYGVVARSRKVIFLIWSIQFILGSIFFSDHIVSVFLNIDITEVYKYQLAKGISFYLAGSVINHTVIRLLPKFFEPIGRIDKAARLSVIINGLEVFVLITLLLFFKFSISSLLLFMGGYYIISSYFVYRYIKRIFPNYFLGIRKGKFKEGWADFIKSTGFLFTNILEKVNNESLPLAISFVLTSAVVPVFYTLKTMTSIIVTGTDLLLNLIIPDLQKLYSQKKGKEILKALQYYWVMVGAPVNFGVVLFLPFVENIFNIWVKDKIEFNLNLFVYLLFSALIINFGAIFLYFTRGINKVKSIFFVTLIRFLILYTIVILSNEGIERFAIGLLISDIVIYLFCLNFIVFKSLHKIGAATYFFNIFINLVPLAISGTFVFFYDGILNVSAMLITSTLLLLYYILAMRRMNIKINIKKLTSRFFNR